MHADFIVKQAEFCYREENGKGALRMREYVERLMRCGYPVDEAYRTVYCMIKDFGTVGLEDFIASLERDCYGMARV